MTSSVSTEGASGLWVKYQETTGKVSTGACNIVTLISLFLPLSMIVFGGVYLDFCPTEPYIPIYLIVGGAFQTGYSLIRIFSTLCMDDMGRRPRAIEIILGLMGIFMLAWFIADNVWIYRLNGKYSSNTADPNNCDRTLYLYAFWVTTASYIVIGIVFVLSCCTACCIGCIGCCTMCTSPQ